MTERLAKAFTAAYGQAPTLIVSAPGRVNLLGEHTDYNDGFVLPVAIPQRTWVALRARSDQRVRAQSTGFTHQAVYELGQEAARARDGHDHATREDAWGAYVQGVTKSLAHAGYTHGGFDAFLSSDVPVGAGLSSSAALEVALLRGLRQLFELPFDELALAKVAQWGENNVVGAPVGILDPMACNLATTEAALFLDTRSLSHERLELPAGLELVVVDSGIRHDHATGDYGTRRRECHEAARLLGVPALRDVDPDDPRIASLPAPLDRRARHVVTENARVLRAVEALREGSGTALGDLFNASHISQRDDFAVSHPAVDALVELAWAEPEVLGARLTGGGFGGSMVALVRQGAAAQVASVLTDAGGRQLVPDVEKP